MFKVVILHFYNVFILCFYNFLRSFSLLFIDFLIPKVIQDLKWFFTYFLHNFFRGRYLSIKGFIEASSLLNDLFGPSFFRSSTLSQSTDSKYNMKFSLSKFSISLLYTFIFPGNFWFSSRIIRNWAKWSETDMVRFPEIPCNLAS